MLHGSALPVKLQHANKRIMLSSIGWLVRHQYSGARVHVLSDNAFYLELRDMNVESLRQVRAPAPSTTASCGVRVAYRHTRGPSCMQKRHEGEIAPEQHCMFWGKSKVSFVSLAYCLSRSIGVHRNRVGPSSASLLTNFY